MVNSSIVSAFVDAVIGKISGLINSHNTSNSAHGILIQLQTLQISQQSPPRQVTSQTMGMELTYL